MINIQNHLEAIEFSFYCNFGRDKSDPFYTVEDPRRIIEPIIKRAYNETN